MARVVESLKKADETEARLAAAGDLPEPIDVGSLLEQANTATKTNQLRSMLRRKFGDRKYRLTDEAQAKALDDEFHRLTGTTP